MITSEVSRGSEPCLLIRDMRINVVQDTFRYKSFEKFVASPEEGNGSVAGRLVFRFTWFKNGYGLGFFQVSRQPNIKRTSHRHVLRNFHEIVQ